jgi:FMN phosphatase YigB (HAD superfamily)
LTLPGGGSIIGPFTCTLRGRSERLSRARAVVADSSRTASCVIHQRSRVGRQEARVWSGDCRSRGVVSVDVGGTLGYGSAPSLASRLVAASALPPPRATSIVRTTLNVAPSLSNELINRLCHRLGIARSTFPSRHAPSRLRVFPGVPDAMRRLTGARTVVTLSNVSCVDFDEADLRQALGGTVAAHYASCRLRRAKPDARVFRTVATRHGVPVSSLVHVGDDWECDVLGALGAGARAVWITRGRALPRDWERLDRERFGVAVDFSEAVTAVCG